MNQIDDLSQLLDDNLIEEYLRDNPDFFSKHPHLLNYLEINQRQEGTVSLVQRQQRMMREKIVSLEDEITSLMSVASANQQLYQQFSALFFDLLNSDDLSTINDKLTQHFIQELGLSHVSFKLFDRQVPAALYINRSELDNLLVQRLDRSFHYFGRINQQEQQLLFNHPEPGSVALIALGKNGDLGLLAINSEDANHFQPEMDNLLLMQLTRLIASLVQRLLAA